MGAKRIWQYLFASKLSRHTPIFMKSQRLTMINDRTIILWNFEYVSFFLLHGPFVNTLRPRYNCRHFTEDIFKCIILNENVWISLTISLKLVPSVPINDIPALVQIMSWHWRIYAWQCAYILITTHTYICTYIYTHMHVYIYIYIYIYIYVCVCVIMICI